MPHGSGTGISPVGDVHFYAKKCGAKKVSKRLRFGGRFRGRLWCWIMVFMVF